MAKPWVLWDNIFEQGTLSSSPGDAAGFPKENINDWRVGNKYRWESSGTVQSLVKVDAGVGNTYQPNTIVVAGHNMGAGGTDVLTTLQYSDNDADWTNVVTHEAAEDTDPWVETFSESGHRYWRLATAFGATAAVQHGIVTVGTRLEFDRLPFSVDPYNRRPEVQRSRSLSGHPLGADLKHVNKRFVFNWDDAGLLGTDLDPASDPSFNELAVHLDDKPCWFAWNLDTDADGVYLCWLERDIAQPFFGSSLRRNPRFTLQAVALAGQ